MSLRYIITISSSLLLLASSCKLPTEDFADNNSSVSTIKIGSQNLNPKQKEHIKKYFFSVIALNCNAGTTAAPPEANEGELSPTTSTISEAKLKQACDHYLGLEYLDANNQALYTNMYEGGEVRGMLIAKTQIVGKPTFEVAPQLLCTQKALDLGLCSSSDKIVVPKRPTAGGNGNNSGETSISIEPTFPGGNSSNSTNQNSQPNKPETPNPTPPTNNDNPSLEDLLNA